MTLKSFRKLSLLSLQALCLTGVFSVSQDLIGRTSPSLEMHRRREAQKEPPCEYYQYKFENEFGEVAIRCRVTMRLGTSELEAYTTDPLAFLKHLNAYAGLSQRYFFARQVRSEGPATSLEAVFDTDDIEWIGDALNCSSESGAELPWPCVCSFEVVKSTFDMFADPEQVDMDGVVRDYTDA